MLTTVRILGMAVKQNYCYKSLCGCRGRTGTTLEQLPALAVEVPTGRGIFITSRLLCDTVAVSSRLHMEAAIMHDPVTRSPRLSISLLCTFCLGALTLRSLLLSGTDYFTTGSIIFDGPGLDSSQLGRATRSFQFPFPLPQLSSYESSSTKPTYTPGSVEKLVLDKATELGYDNKNPQGDDGCNIWLNKASKIDPDIHKNLTMYLEELKRYNELLKDFAGSPVGDIRTLLTSDEDRENACQKLELHPQGLQGIFGGSQQLSHSTSFGWIEPILPPQRSPEYCFDKSRSNLLSMGYLVHDFAAMCRKLKPTSRTVLIDMGASLSFHNRDKDKVLAPPIYLMEMFRTFGMPFDHIYAFEITPTKPEKVIQNVPDHFLAAYHWFNVGVDFDVKSKSNPLKLVLENFTPDDLVIVKLDIDTPDIEIPLAKQVLENEELHPLIDHFYFEHHVLLKQLRPNWKHTMKGSIKESLDLFVAIREKGIGAHFWP